LKSFHNDIALSDISALSPSMLYIAPGILAAEGLAPLCEAAVDAAGSATTLSTEETARTEAEPALFILLT